MARVNVTGASDDLIEVTGDLQEEWTCTLRPGDVEADRNDEVDLCGDLRWVVISAAPPVVRRAVGRARAKS